MVGGVEYKVDIGNGAAKGVDLSEYDDYTGLDYDGIGNEEKVNDGFLNLHELKDMLSALGDDTMSDEEAEALAEYLISHPDRSSYNEETPEGVISLEDVMKILDSEENGGDGDGVIEMTDAQAMQEKRDIDLINIAKENAGEFDDGEVNNDEEFTLSDGTSNFSFEFKEAYEDDLASIINVDGSLSKEGLEGLLTPEGVDPANVTDEQRAEMMNDPKVKAVIAMGLMATGLDEAEVVFIMSQLTNEHKNTAEDSLFSITDLLTIAEETSETEEGAFDTVFADKGISQS